MRIRRVERAELEEIANRPDVRPLVAPLHATVDLGWVYDDPNILVLGAEGVIGAGVLVPKGNSYELHLLAPDKGGLGMLRAGRDWAFANTDAESIIGIIPRDNLAARIAGRWLGGVPVRTTTDFAGRPCIVYELKRPE